jgi:acyl-coenzyme A synthetase/AMP-(fatty) acid ligase
MPNQTVAVIPKTDKRLLGRWKSDARLTFADWNWKKGTSPARKARLKSLFGKLELTYTRTKVISRLRHRRWEQARRYAVLGLDADSVAIMTFGKLEIKARREYDLLCLELLDQIGSVTKVEHIHFVKNHFWISIADGRHREFFRKISRNR